MMIQVLRYNYIIFNIILNSLFLIRKWWVWYEKIPKCSMYVFVLGLIANCNYLVMNNYTNFVNNE